MVIANVVSIVVLLVLVVLFAWLTRRAWGSRRRILKWVGVVLAGLLTLLLALVTVVALIGFYKAYAPVGYAVPEVKVAGSADQVAAGQRLAHFCEGCHSSSGALPLDGGNDNFGSFPGGPPVAALYPPNLTPAGELKGWSDGDIIRAIREGVHKSGRPLLVMPAEIFHHMSDADVQALVAYLHSQPATPHSANNDTPSNGVNVLGALFVGAGIFQTSVQPEITQPVVSPPRGVSVEYGKYLVTITGCNTCHGADLAGGTPGGFGPPAGPNLTVLVPQWSDTLFIKTIRTGVDPTGHQLNPTEMPYKEISAAYEDDQLEAIYTYLHGLAPIVKPAK